MAISQNRLITLLHIAETLLSNQKSTAQFITQIALQANPHNPADLLSSIHAIQQFAAQQSLSPEHYQTLSDEKAHFAANAKKNERLALKARAKRGVPPSASKTSPNSIGKKLNLQEFAIGAQRQTLETSGAQRQTLETSSPQSTLAPQSTLYKQKLSINATCRECSLPLPYPDPSNDSQPLDPDHYAILGLTPPATNSEVF